MLAFRLFLLSAAAALSACARTPPPQTLPSAMPASATRTSVTDLAAFEAFIATRPTPDAFAANYPGVALVLPGMIATKELRMDHSRYFAELDAEGRIAGGRFQ